MLIMVICWWWGLESATRTNRFAKLSRTSHKTEQVMKLQKIPRMWFLAKVWSDKVYLWTNIENIKRLIQHSYDKLWHRQYRPGDKSLKPSSSVDNADQVRLLVSIWVFGFPIFIGNPSINLTIVIINILTVNKNYTIITIE